jgi:peroxiredoxin
VQRIEAQNAILLGISKYDVDETKRWVEENDWSFPLLANGEAVIERYGLSNPDVTREEHKGIPHPATIIVDKEGIVRFINVWVNYRERTSPDTIVKELEKLQ